MAFCTKCGLKNDPSTKFCISCGTHLAVSAPNSENRFAPKIQDTERSPLPSSEINSTNKPPQTAVTDLSRLPTRRVQQESIIPVTNQSEDPATSVRRESISDSTGLSQDRATGMQQESVNPITSGFRPYLIIGVLAVVLFAGYKFYVTRSAATENIASVSSAGPSSLVTDTSLATANEPLNPANESSPAPASGNAETSNRAAYEEGSAEWYKDHVARLYQAENQLSDQRPDFSTVLAFYAFPLDRYYTAKRVDAGRLTRIYHESYAETLQHHQVLDFENKMTVSRQGENTIKVIAGCRFEFSTKQSPDSIRSRSVYNVYVFNANGKITSVYQLL